MVCWICYEPSLSMIQVSGSESVVVDCRDVVGVMSINVPSFSYDERGGDNGNDNADI